MSQQPPQRLLDDPRISAQLRSDLANARAHATSYDVDRGLAALRDNLADLTTGAPGGGLASMTGRWWAWTATGIATVGAVWWLQREAPPLESAPRGATPLSMQVAPSEHHAPDLASPLSPVQPERIDPTPSSAHEVKAAPTRRPRRTREVEPTPSDDSDVEPATAPVREPSREPEPAQPSDRMAELEQLARVRRLLVTSPREALEAARDGQARFADGLFVEERAGLIVFALDRLGAASQARAEGQRFLRAHPDAPFAARIRGIVERTR